MSSRHRSRPRKLYSFTLTARRLSSCATDHLDLDHIPDAHSEHEDLTTPVWWAFPVPESPLSGARTPAFTRVQASRPTGIQGCARLAPRQTFSESTGALQA